MNTPQPEPTPTSTATTNTNTDTVVWSGHPDPDYLARSARVMVPIGGLFIFSGIGFTIIAATEILRWFFVFGLPIIGLGIVLLDAPRQARKRAARTEYILTPKAALTRKPTRFGGKWIETRIGPPELAQIESIGPDDGPGQVIFFAHDTEAGEGITIVHSRFDGITNAPAVAEIARKTLLT